MHARVVLGVGKGVLFREVSSVHECPYRESTLIHLSSCRDTSIEDFKY